MTEQDDALRRLVDKDEIRAVLHSYCRGIDRGDAQLMSSIYHDDGLDFHGSGSGPGKEFGPRTKERMANDPRFATMHFLGPTTFVFDGDIAHTETYVRATLVVEGPEGWHLELFIGRYLDRFERRDSTWLIARRITMRDFMGATPITPMMPERPYQGLRSEADVSYAHLQFEELAVPDWP